ncbi:MAG: metalloregulator ArsR/SmtB family transcription factor [Syntrophomonadaceae bacterium]
MIENTVNILKALGEPTRLKIIRFLAERELCICELVAVLDMSQPRVSQHVKVLKKAGLVTERRVRQNSYLSINRAVLEGAGIIPLGALMQTRLDGFSELAQEFSRFQGLDNNEEVIACKANRRCEGRHPNQKIS